MAIRTATVLRPLLAMAVMTTLVAAVAGGLLRAGGPGSVWLADSETLGRAAGVHAALMLSGFLGSVISIERAVALKRAWSFGAPLCALLGALALLGGAATAGAALLVVASAVFVGVNLRLVALQRAPHTALLLVGALAWLAGNLLFAAGRNGTATLAAWFAFPVLTIAAERLEMTRLMRRHAAAAPAMALGVLLLLGGAAVSVVDVALGSALYGVALMGLALWLGVYDIARRTVRARGLTRYMALCLLAGYAWLGLAGLAWLGMAFGCPGRDIAMHALGLGFIVGMVMAHAPVILPAVARVKLLFGPWFYAPLGLLQVSLALRLADPAWRAAGAWGNALALALFVATVAGSAIAWRRRGRDGRPPEPYLRVLSSDGGGV